MRGVPDGLFERRLRESKGASHVSMGISGGGTSRFRDPEACQV